VYVNHVYGKRYIMPQMCTEVACEDTGVAETCLWRNAYRTC